MKHSLQATILLVLLFFLAHTIGLLVVNHYLEEDLPYNIQKPEIDEQVSYIPIFIMILLGTILALILIRFRANRLWKFWFLFSVVITLSIAFSSFLVSSIAFILALLLALIRLYKPNPLVHNFTELFIYGGLAAVFVPILNLFSVSILLILISIYDFIAVFKTKHMIKLAKFQTNSKIFTGLSLPYKREKEKKISTAILGGGDIGFTLLFSGVILKFYSLPSALLVSGITTLALLGLFYYGRKNKFYPAMPILSLGCFIGYSLILLL